MPRGGARPNSGPKPGYRNVDIKNPAVAEMVALEMRARAADPSRKQGREILSTACNLMMGLAGRCQQVAEKNAATGLPADAKVEETFWKALDRACTYAHWVAPFESPTFRSIMLVPPDEDKGRPGDTAREIRCQVFDALGVVVMDELVEVTER